MRPKTDGILESSLYLSDVARSVRFYQDLSGNFRIRQLFLAEVLHHLDNALRIGLTVKDGAPVSRRAQVG